MADKKDSPICRIPVLHVLDGYVSKDMPVSRLGNGATVTEPAARVWLNIMQYPGRYAVRPETISAAYGV